MFMDVYVLMRTGEIGGKLIVYANNEEEALGMAERFDEVGTWIIIQKIKSFTQIIHYEV